MRPLNSSFVGNRLVGLALSAVVLLVAGTAGGGCAVLTVDVDVYKGPLANHVDVQVQQAAATAVAAKPLLGKLRYQLERLARYRVNRDIDHDPALKRLQDVTDFVPPYVLSEDGDITERMKANPSAVNRPDNCAWLTYEDEQAARGEEFAFVSPQAAFVNRILAEYNTANEDEQLRKYLGLPPTPEPGRKLLSPSEMDKVWEARIRPYRAYAPGRDHHSLGLETLVRDYLDAKAKANDGGAPSDPTMPGWYVREQRNLFDALVQVSQKILFVVNNEVLFEDKVGFPRYLKARLVFAFNGGPDPADTKESYVRVLQSIGNSIIVSLNELRENLQHEQALAQPAAVGSELRALEAALRQSPEQVVGGLRRSVELELAELVRTAPGHLPAARNDEQVKLDAAKAALDSKRGILEGKQKVATDKAAAALPRADLVRLLDGDVLNSAAAKADKPLEAADGKVLHQKLLAAIAAEVGSLNPDSPRLGPLLKIAKLLEDAQVKGSFEAVTGANPAEVLGKAKDVANGLAAAANAESATANAELAAARADAGAAQAAFDAQGAVVARYDRRIKLTGVAAALAVSAPKVLAAVDSTDRPPSPETVLDRLLKQLVADKAAVPATRPATAPASAPATAPSAAATVPADQFDDAIAAVKERPSPTPLLAFDQKPTSRKQVVDQLIAALTYEYVEVVKREGKASPIAQRYEDALEVAYGRRADMMYIRPASAFLRSSFPASSLQRDSRIGWTNMLAGHGLRQIPFLGRLAANDYRSPQDLRTVLELDKQNWQNVNTIRVAGGGDTNYVVAKDDIGNWYVKNYSSNPEDIIKSAAGLATFALGPGVKGAASVADAARQQTKAAEVAARGTERTSGGGGGGGGSTDQPPPAAKPPLKGMADDARAAHDKRAAAGLKTLADPGKAADLKRAVVEKWKANADANAVLAKLEPALAAPADELAKAATAAGAGATGTAAAGGDAGRLTDLLVAYGKFEADVRAAVTAALAGTPGGDATAKTAADLARGAVRAAAGPTFDDWSAATDRYAVEVDQLARTQSK